jgi:hypothetical protein
MAAAVVRNAGGVGEKWARRAGSAGQEYSIGVAGAGQRWATGAAAAAATYQQGVTAAIARGAFAKGVTRAGAARYTKGATEKGPGRFAEGVQVAQGDYQAAVAPYLQVIGATDLPPRGPAGAQGNYQRVVAIGTALRKLKESR